MVLEVGADVGVTDGRTNNSSSGLCMVTRVLSSSATIVMY